MNKTTSWLLGIFSACIILFMGWVGTTITRLDRTVEALVATNKIEIQELRRDVAENKAKIEKVSAELFMHQLIARKEDDDEF